MIDFSIKPSVDDWFNLERQEDLISSFSTLHSTLCIYGNIDECLIAWIKLEVVNELMNHSSFESMNREDQDLLNLLVTKEHMPESSSGIYSDLIEACDKSIQIWCDIYWQNKIDALFLRFKDKLDRVSCYFMRVERKEIATEIFHRLRSEEQTFDQLGLIYGLGKERFKGSYFESECLSSLPKKLIPYAK